MQTMENFFSFEKSKELSQVFCVKFKKFTVIRNFHKKRREKIFLSKNVKVHIFCCYCEDLLI